MASQNSRLRAFTCVAAGACLLGMACACAQPSGRRPDVHVGGSPRSVVVSAVKKLGAGVPVYRA